MNILLQVKGFVPRYNITTQPCPPPFPPMNQHTPHYWVDMFIEAPLPPHLFLSPPPPPPPGLKKISFTCSTQNITISFICSIFALIFLVPEFASPGSRCSRKTELLKFLDTWQNTEKSSARALRLLCHKMPLEIRSSDERRQPTKPTLERKAAGIVYLSFSGVNLTLRHRFSAKLKRRALHVVQAPAMLFLGTSLLTGDRTVPQRHRIANLTCAHAQLQPVSSFFQ